MNGRKAKALRKALLNGDSGYTEGPKGKKITTKNGEPIVNEITGTIQATGARRQYQSVKRDKKLRAVLLGARNG